MDRLPARPREEASSLHIGCWYREKGQQMLLGKGTQCPPEVGQVREGHRRGPRELGPEGQTEACWAELGL